MKKYVKKRLEMLTRAREFSRANPSTAPGQVARLAELDDHLRRADGLAIRERAGRLQELAAATRRRELRRSIQADLLFHLVRVGQLAGEQNPDLAGKFVLPSTSSPHVFFLAASKQMLATADANKDLLLSLGLADTLLDELRQELGEFEATIETGLAGRREHIEASRELREVADAGVKTVDQLNGLNRHRFKKDPAKKAAWNAIRIIGPRVSRDAKGDAPPSGGVSSAA